MNAGTLATTVVATGVALYGALLWLMPQLTRRDVYFAVTVSPLFRETLGAQRTLRRYRLQIAVVSAALTISAIVLGSQRPLLAPIALYAEAIASFVAFYDARRRTLPHAATITPVREASLVARPNVIPGGPLAVTGPFVILAIAAGYLNAHAGDLPALIPVHFDFRWQPDAWGARTPATLFAPLLIALTTVVVLTVSLHGLGHWVRAAYSGGALDMREVRFRRAVAAILLASSYLVAAEFSFVALLPFYRMLHLSMGMGLAIGFAPLAVAIIGVVVLVRFSNNGCRVPVSLDAPAVGDRTPDHYWRLGIFYVNSNDPAILVEKRFGLGYTVNFGHTVSWLLVIVPIVLAASLPFVFHHSS